MRILIIHPVMSFLGGGERLCCETIKALLSAGHDITLLSETFDYAAVESFFGYEGLFRRIRLLLYPKSRTPARLGSYSHLIHSLRNQDSTLRRNGITWRDLDLAFSTQDPGYLPDVGVPVVQWGYFPRTFPRYPTRSFGRVVRYLPLEFHYARKVSRISLVLAISEYSKSNIDKQWKRPSVIVYPACNMIPSQPKRNLVVTVGRAIPEKRLESFWTVAQQCPNYEFLMLVTKDADRIGYFDSLIKSTPENGRVVVNPVKQVYHKLIGESKVYLHLMENEHFGITVVEAMSAQCVPVVHNSGGPKEIVRDVGFRWNRIDDVPNLVGQAMDLSPCRGCGDRARDFSAQAFATKISSLFGGLRPRSP